MSDDSDFEGFNPDDARVKCAHYVLPEHEEVAVDSFSSDSDNYADWDVESTIGYSEGDSDYVTEDDPVSDSDVFRETDDDMLSEDNEPTYEQEQDPTYEQEQDPTYEQEQDPTYSQPEQNSLPDEQPTYVNQHLHVHVHMDFHFTFEMCPHQFDY